MRRAAQRSCATVIPARRSERSTVRESTRDRTHGLAPALWRLLARVEQDYYRRIPRPDVVIRLDVPVDVAQRRNRDRVKPDKESDAYLVERHEQFSTRRTMEDANVRRVDTRRPCDDVLADLRAIVCGSL